MPYTNLGKMTKCSVTNPVITVHALFKHDSADLLFIPGPKMARQIREALGMDKESGGGPMGKFFCPMTGGQCFTIYLTNGKIQKAIYVRFSSGDYEL